MRLSPVFLSVGFILSAVPPAPAVAQDAGADEQAIRQLIEDAYVSGIFINRDESAVRGGFHPDFVMAVNDDGQLVVVTLEMWLQRLTLDGERSPDTVKPVFERVDITGSTAVAKLEMWINDRHVYTDYLSLYRFDDGWKIVGKVFQRHD